MSLFDKLKAEKAKGKKSTKSGKQATKAKGKGKPMAEGQFPDFLKKGGK